ncbi:hypothetical protein H4Q26_001986 [Puccinia striiformis f. sp. tritici PST-130]|nr:hypothetical protein H4Q26_001986 [Puccinia striiformis f. sp. tritici PST-130]
MRFIGNTPHNHRTNNNSNSSRPLIFADHEPTSTPPPEPPPNYEVSTLHHPPTNPFLERRYGHQQTHDEDRPQHHTVQLDRSTTSSSSTSSQPLLRTTNLAADLPSAHSSHPDLASAYLPVDQPHHHLRLPSGGVTPQQLSFLGDRELVQVRLTRLPSSDPSSEDPHLSPPLRVR